MGTVDNSTRSAIVRNFGGFPLNPSARKLHITLTVKAASFTLLQFVTTHTYFTVFIHPDFKVSNVKSQNDKNLRYKVNRTLSSQWINSVGVAYFGRPATIRSDQCWVTTSVAYNCMTFLQPHISFWTLPASNFGHRNLLYVLFNFYETTCSTTTDN
jgi:hypothetical protein